MQNYGQGAPYQRPGSTASYGSQPPPPPPPPGYTASQGYQSAAPTAQSQWPAPTPTQTVNPWNQPPQATVGGYNPSTYGAIGGQPQPPAAQVYPDQPPPPPPKPQGFAAAVQQQQQQQAQNWPQQPQQPQQDAGYQHQAQQGSYPAQASQQPYNNAAPPPPSATPGGSYFPPSHGGRPGSMYGASQAGAYAGNSQQPSTVMSPNEQQPAYIPPSLTGQGVQAYMPSNTNPAPGVYVPPPPDIPAWQQAQHAPLQGGSKKFTYTKPVVDPSFYAQGYQSTQSMHAPPLPPRHHDQMQHAPVQQPMVPPQQFTQQVQTQQHIQQPQNQYVTQQTHHPQQSAYGQPNQPLHQHQQQPHHSHEQPLQQVYGQAPGLQHQQQPVYQQDAQASQNYQGSGQWQSTPGMAHGIPEQANSALPHVPNHPDQQQQWQPGHQPQPSVPGGSYGHGPSQDIQAPTPLGRTNTAPSEFFNQPGPQSQPVSPINQRQSTVFTPGHQSGSGHAGSISSIAIANLQAQRSGNRTSSPKPIAPKLPTPPPPRDDKSKFSALGSGGPSDWERFGAEEEIDDEELFSSKKESKAAEANHDNSVELPAHVPSPPSTHGWPSPATHPAPLNASGRRSTFAPTPPPGIANANHTLPPQPSQQSTTAPEIDAVHAPTTQQSAVMTDGGWAGQSLPVHEQLHDATQSQHQPPPVATSFVMDDGAWGANTRTPTQADVGRPNEEQIEALKQKDDEYERSRAELTSAQDSLRAEMESMKSDLEKTKSDLIEAHERAEKAKHELAETTSKMENDIAQAKTTSDAMVREKDLTLERMKEDIEGKEHNIGERDATIATLKRELEEERRKEPPKPNTADLVSDLDPWYAASLDRFITMLRAEANEPQIEEKIKIFRSFLKSESQVRGIEFYEAPPAAPAVDFSSHQPGVDHDLSQTVTIRPLSTQDLHVQVPQKVSEENDLGFSPGGRPVLRSTDPSNDDDYDFSPGGRPIIKSKDKLNSTENIPSTQHFNASAPSTTILTPASSIGEDANKTPVQSPPEEQPQPQYKAYVPPTASTTDSMPSNHRHTSSFSNSTPVVSPPVTSQGHDDLFFEAPGPSISKTASRSVSSDSTSPEISIPAPLSFTPNRPGSTAPPPKKSPEDALVSALPRSLDSREESGIVRDLRTGIRELKPHLSNIDDLVKTWEKSASLTRRKKDDARRKRQDENEEQNGEAFENNEMSYAEMNQIENDFNQKENELKAQEDRDEYKSYVEAVFDPVYDGLQADIKDLMDMYVEVEAQLATSVSGIKSLENAESPSTLKCLELLKELHEHIETKHEKVVQAVAERDKRYKKTETQPLYAAGNIAKMKSVEKHFENAEKQAVVRSKSEHAQRVGELVNLAEDVVVNAVGVEQKGIDSIIAAVKNLEDGKGSAELLDRAQKTLAALKASSKSLLHLFNDLEIRLNSSVLDAEIAQARAENADAARVQGLESEKAAGAKKMTDEYERRVAVLVQDEAEVRDLIRRKGGEVELTEEQEKEERLKAALEEAKRRNGQA